MNKDQIQKWVAKTKAPDGGRTALQGRCCPHRRSGASDDRLCRMRCLLTTAPNVHTLDLNKPKLYGFELRSIDSSETLRITVARYRSWQWPASSSKQTPQLSPRAALSALCYIRPENRPFSWPTCVQIVFRPEKGLFLWPWKIYQGSSEKVGWKVCRVKYKMDTVPSQSSPRPRFRYASMDERSFYEVLSTFRVSYRG